MTRWEDVEEIMELQKEINGFLNKIHTTKEFEEFKMYREMIKFNINLIRILQERK